MTMNLCGLSLVAFVVGCAELNLLCLALCPVACLLILGYSLTKRFTSYTHAFLGFALAAAPMGAWAATRGELTSYLPWILAAAVWCWVFGFDLIYATQDVEFDQQARLHSHPARHGVTASLRLARALHACTWLILIGFGCAAGLSLPYWVAMILILGALVVEHLLCRTGDLARINIAFFQMNALVGLFLVLGIAASLYWAHGGLLAPPKEMGG
jgi:4-hydroxybenzoate polyprenyltransferase